MAHDCGDSIYIDYDIKKSYDLIKEYGEEEAPAAIEIDIPWSSSTGR